MSVSENVLHVLFKQSWHAGVLFVLSWDCVCCLFVFDEAGGILALDLSIVADGVLFACGCVVFCCLLLLSSFDFVCFGLLDLFVLAWALGTAGFEPFCLG